MNPRNVRARPAWPPSASDSRGWPDAFACALIRRAARHAPPSLSERLEEEWLADLAARRGRLLRLRFSLGCCWAAAAILHEHGVATAAAAASASGPKSTTVHVQSDPSFLSRRTFTFLAILCLHAALIYALATGLARKVVEAIPPPVTAVFARKLLTPTEPPPLPRLSIVPPRAMEIPEPDIPVDIPLDGDALQGVIPPPPQTRSPPVRAVNRVVGGPGKGFPDTEEYYPSASRRMAEAGAATVRVCVDAAGRLTSEPAIVQSSGSPRIDEGALRLAKAGSGYYRPSTEDGRPIGSCFPFRIRFQLRD